MVNPTYSLLLPIEKTMRVKANFNYFRFCLRSPIGQEIVWVYQSRSWVLNWSQVCPRGNIFTCVERF